MNIDCAVNDWATTRGEKWRAQLAGMEAMLAPVTEPLIEALHLDAPYRVADIGCGGGGTTFEVSRRAPPGTIVRGFDISPVLIEAARARTHAEEKAIAFEVADMETAALQDERYDRLVSRFGIMFFGNPAAAFGNLARWLAPGGRFAFATWGRPAENPWLTTVRQAVSELISVPPPDPEAPGPFRYADADMLLALLAQCGFATVGVHDWCGVLPVGGGLSAPEAANFALTSLSSFSEQLAEAGDHAFATACRTLTALLAEHEHEGHVQMEAVVHIFTGTRI